jgi:hypothetical protein
MPRIVNPDLCSHHAPREDSFITRSVTTTLLTNLGGIRYPTAEQISAPLSRRWKMGKRCKLAILALTMLAGLNGCSSMNHTERDTLAGGAAGAAIGALADRRHPGTGAAIGGVAGGLLGAAVGSNADAQDRHVKAVAAANAPVRGPLSLQEVADMVHKGIGDDVIRNTIRTSGTVYNLAPADIAWLHDNGVSDPVIAEMQQTGYYRRRAVYIDRPYYYDPVYVVPPPRPVVYGPAVSLGFYHIR